MDNSDEPKKDIVLFGRNISQIPCFRSSFLYGIIGGICCGLGYFQLTSRVQAATHFGVGGFTIITLIYWVQCRYHWSKNKFTISQIEAAMREHALHEGVKIDEKK